MPEIRINVGDRSYTVACQAGEELHLQSAASLLDVEARTVLKSGQNVPEAQLLLMAGLMLADKAASDDDQGAYAEHKLSELQSKLDASERKAMELSRSLEAAKSAQAPATGAAEHDLLEKMAVELERLADEMEAASA